MRIIVLLLLGVVGFGVLYARLRQLDLHVTESFAQRQLDKELMNAIRRGATAQVRVLLQQGADPQTLDRGGDSDVDGEGGWNALLIAAEGPDNGVVEELLKTGADPNVADERGNTALMISAYLGNKRAVESLIRHGAKVNTRRINGDTALRNAKQQGKTEVVALLKRNGAID